MSESVITTQENNSEHDQLLLNVGETLAQGRQKAAYAKSQTLSDLLSRSHYVEFVNILSLFFLELGKGFTYAGRQQKMVIGERT